MPEDASGDEVNGPLPHTLSKFREEVLNEFSTLKQRLDSIQDHLYFEGLDRTRIRRHIIEEEDRARDIIEAITRGLNVAPLGWHIITEHPLASDTPDHLFPRGTKDDNTRHPRFVARCEDLWRKPIRHLDLGCAGGGLVWDFTQRGHLSAGIEGSDFSRRHQRSEWRTIPDRLFTADLRFPFRILNELGTEQTFDIVTAWELLEHIPEEFVPSLLTSVRVNLNSGGLFAASVATFKDVDALGNQFHATIRNRAWWFESFERAGLEIVPWPFEVGDFPRGSGNPRVDDWNANTQPEHGFHIVARSVR